VVVEVHLNIAAEVVQVDFAVLSALLVVAVL
jgi:hypothetical protein